MATRQNDKLDNAAPEAAVEIDAGTDLSAFTFQQQTSLIAGRPAYGAATAEVQEFASMYTTRSGEYSVEAQRNLWQFHTQVVAASGLQYFVDKVTAGADSMEDRAFKAADGLTLSESFRGLVATDVLPSAASHTLVELAQRGIDAAKFPHLRQLHDVTPIGTAA